MTFTVGDQVDLRRIRLLVVLESGIMTIKDDCLFSGDVCPGRRVSFSFRMLYCSF